MKAFIHFSVLLTNHPGGLTQAWQSNSLIKLLFTSIQTSIIASFSSSSASANSILQQAVSKTSSAVASAAATSFTSPVLSKTLLSSSAAAATSAAVKDTAAATFRVLYSPFPVCFLPPTITNQTSVESHALFSSQILYYFLFPFSDDRLWQLILCKLEHFHLGFFLLGSVNNIYFTYKILNDMFDIVLLGQDNTNNEAPVEIDEEQRLDGITRRLSKLLKGFLLTYCCSLVILFWIHFNIFAFHVDSKYEYTSNQFVAELPLWTLRWVTLGVAVGDFTARGIYRWLSKLTNCVDQEVVLSLPEEN
jgi:hypothetical protein